MLIGNTFRYHGGFSESTHYRYPCLGPMCYKDFSKTACIRSGTASEVMRLNNHPDFKFLRKSQFQPGTNAVCDLCREVDSRDPRTHNRIIKQLELI
jgi:hypothetical protein